MKHISFILGMLHISTIKSNNKPNSSLGKGRGENKGIIS